MYLMLSRLLGGSRYGHLSLIGQAADLYMAHQCIKYLMLAAEGADSPARVLCIKEVCYACVQGEMQKAASAEIPLAVKSEVGNAF